MNQNADTSKRMPASLKVVPTIKHASHPLDEDITRFWSVGPEFEAIEFKIEPSQQPLALLKKLGPSPFSGGGFPLIGFLATTYDKVSRYAIERLDRADHPNYE